MKNAAARPDDGALSNCHARPDKYIGSKPHFTANRDFRTRDVKARNGIIVRAGT